MATHWTLGCDANDANDADDADGASIVGPEGNEFCVA